jgi:ornithine cyclodeaminase
MTKVIELDKIKQVIPEIDIISIIEAGFIAYSEGKVTVPPIF